MTIRIVDRHHDREALAERVLRDLPDWFGIEESTLDYIAAAGRLVAR